jgi:hypothetical protein
MWLRDDRYSAIFPSLYSLVVNAFPFLFSVDDMLHTSLSPPSSFGMSHTEAPRASNKRKYSEISDAQQGSSLIIAKKKTRVFEGDCTGSINEVEDLLHTLPEILHQNRQKYTHDESTNPSFPSCPSFPSFLSFLTFFFLPLPSLSFFLPCFPLPVPPFLCPFFSFSFLRSSCLG